MRSEGAAPGPAAPLCGALSLVLGALLGRVIESRGVADSTPRFSSLPPYLPVSFSVQGADSAFFLQETQPQDALRNASLRARIASFFAYKAQQPPVLNASYGPFWAGKAVPPELVRTSSAFGPSSRSAFDWKLKATILRDKIYPSRPKVQVLFHLLGRAWDEPRPAERLPCLRVFAVLEAREVRGSCRLGGALGLCVAELEVPASWFGVAPAPERKKPAEQPEGSPVELYYSVQPADARGDCPAGGDPRTGNAIRPGKEGSQGPASHPQSAGLVHLCRAQDSEQLRELRLDADLAVWLPARPAKQGAVVTAYVTVSGNSTVDAFVLRAKVKKGVSILSAQTSEPQQWDVKQEVWNGGKHATATVACQRLGAHNSGSLFGEVVQMNFEIASFSSLSGTQPITWQVEYPRRGTSSAAVSEVFVSQQDLVGIVPLAVDTEILNTAILTGKTVAMPVRVVSVEEHGAVTDVSEQVECVSTDEDVIKVSGHCDYIFVNGREVKGKTDVAVNFVFRHLSAPLQVTVWAPRLPLHIDVSDTELSQIKGWRVPLAASGRPTHDSEDEEERRGRGCALQFQRATVRVLAQFVSEAAGPWAQPRHLLGPGWRFDVSALVADFVKLEVPRVASLQEYGVLAGQEVGMTTVQVLSPLSDSILAEKTVTVLDDKVSVTELAIQLVAGLSVSLYPYTEHSRAITAVATAEELLRTPKQEAVVSTWLQFSDGSVTPLDIYDSKDFSLAASSLDEAVVSVSQPHSPHWPIVVAEGTGQGPLVRVDMSIAESCQKSKRRSVLAVGFGNVRVKFGQSNVDAGTGATEEEEEQAGAESENRSSDRRQKGLEGPPQSGSAGELKEGALWRAGSRAKAQPEGKAVQNSHPSGDELPHTIPLDFSNFPGHLGLPGAGAGLQGGGLVPTARGLSDLEIGMYALLGVFCLAILVFLINCATFALKFRRKQVPLEGQASVTHLHDWVWLGNEAELLESMGNPTSPPEEHTTAIDHGPGHCRESELLLVGRAGAQQQVPGQVHWAVGGGAQQEPHPLASQRKRVQFATFPAIPVPPVGGSAVATSILGVH